METFGGNILIIGCGSVAQCVLPLLFKHISINPSQITVLDCLDKKNTIQDSLNKGVNYVQSQVTKENYQALLSSYLSKGDLLLDLSVGIDTCALIQWCHEQDILFVNTSIEIWGKDDITHIKNFHEQSLYLRHIKLEQMIKTWKHSGPTAIIEHGANPGLVSHFAKQALLDIAKELLQTKMNPSKKALLEKALQEKDFALLAQVENVKVIHISEKDTQISSIPKASYEFINTWSCDGLIEEGAAPAEVGFGTHEEALPEHGLEHTTGLKHQILLKTRGCNSFVRSWVPSGPIIGMIIRHGESYTLCKKLSVYENGKAIYRPTVHYAYQLCNDAVTSLQDLEKTNWKSTPKTRILNDEIISGHDELGCLLMGHDFDSWWIGSILDIDAARKLVPHQSATTVQVAIGVVAAMVFAITHPRLGFCVPDDLDHEFILTIAKPYLGTFLSTKASFHPEFAKKWQLTEFLLKQ
ncbi:MAG: saccharopine dehydrogenase NADP-binding domain-containing protein [Chlamydiales bacterium]|nr:saccharopine dehydrogenase NADP-binding domain-containing protein [Chlamydiales bacterium]